MIDPIARNAAPGRKDLLLRAASSVGQPRGGARRPRLDYSPLRSAAMTRTPEPTFRPNWVTTSLDAGTVMFRAGGMLMPARTLGFSSGVLTVPWMARPFRSSGEALSMRIL